MIWFHIAESIGCTVEEAQIRVTYSEFCKWLLFYKDNPPLRDHINNVGANIAYWVYMTSGAKEKRNKKVSDFVLDYKKANRTEDEKMKDDIGDFMKTIKGLNNG